METFAFVTDNWEAIVAVIAAVHGLALAVVNLTPTPIDDQWYGRIYKAVEFAAGVFSYKAKELPGERELMESFDLF